MSEYWFTNNERELLCINPECHEHGDGDEPCDIPKNQPSKSVLGNVSILQPDVEVEYSDDV